MSSVIVLANEAGYRDNSKLISFTRKVHFLSVPVTGWLHFLKSFHLLKTKQRILVDLRGNCALHYFSFQMRDDRGAREPPCRKFCSRLVMMNVYDLWQSKLNTQNKMFIGVYLYRHLVFICTEILIMKDYEQIVFLVQIRGKKYIPAGT